MIHELPPLTLEDHRSFNPTLGALCVSGAGADPYIDSMGTPDVSLDIETFGLAQDRWTVKCVSVAWTYGASPSSAGTTVAVLLNPLRDPDDAERLHRIVDSARVLVGANVCFDFPVLYHHGWVTTEHLDKVIDLFQLHRMSNRSTDWVSLSSLVQEFFPHENFTPQKTVKHHVVLGLDKGQNRYAVQDIDSFSYRRGSFADVVYTLRIYPKVYGQVVAWLRQGYRALGLEGMFDPATVIAQSVEVQRVMLKTAARGLRVDTSYPASYRAEVEQEMRECLDTLDTYGLRDATDNQFRKFLTDNGIIDRSWSMTKSGKQVSLDKKQLARHVDKHPTIHARSRYKYLEHVINDYIHKTVANIGPDGNLHFTAAVHGAASTGRMSYSDPPLQQFSKDARPVILAPEGTEFWSVDWTSIEPVLLAYLADDARFIEAYEAGEGVYEQVMKLTNTTRPVAKVLTLAFNYGQGPTSLASDLKCSVAQARSYQNAIASGWSRITEYTRKLEQDTARTGLVWTIGGRVLPCPEARLAVNYKIQGSAADLLNLALLECARQGISDHIHLAVHDEVVTTTEYAEQVGRILSTPPWELRHHCKRVPVLRADPERLGPHWTKT